MTLTVGDLQNKLAGKPKDMHVVIFDRNCTGSYACGEHSDEVVLEEDLPPVFALFTENTMQPTLSTETAEEKA